MLSASWSTNVASPLTVILCSGGLAGASSAVKTQKHEAQGRCKQWLDKDIIIYPT